jgi:hypothetical protein
MHMKKTDRHFEMARRTFLTKSIGLAALGAAGTMVFDAIRKTVFPGSRKKTDEVYPTIHADAIARRKTKS